MKFIVCAVVAIVAFQYVSCYIPTQESGELDRVDLSVLRERLQERIAFEQVRSKINAVCPGYGNKLENVTAEVATCADSIDESEETMCSIVKNHFRRCIKPLTNMFEECLPAQAREIPVMAVDMLIAVSNHLCKTDGEHIFELGNSCIKNINPKTQRCVRRVATRVQQYQRKGSVPSASDVCELMESLRPCVQSHLTTACGHPITRESYLELFDESMKVCKNYESNKIDVEVVDIE